MSDIREIVRNSREISEFQRRVYLALLDVPRGETITYGELARRVGCRSAQAIGQALRRNPFAPDVPCHRVVAKGGLGGFCGEISGNMVQRKRRLLEEEGAMLRLETEEVRLEAEQLRLEAETLQEGAEAASKVK